MGLFLLAIVTFAIILHFSGAFILPSTEGGNREGASICTVVGGSNACGSCPVKRSCKGGIR